MGGVNAKGNTDGALEAKEKLVEEDEDGDENGEVV